MSGLSDFMLGAAGGIAQGFVNEYDRMNEEKKDIRKEQRAEARTVRAEKRANLEDDRRSARDLSHKFSAQDRAQALQKNWEQWIAIEERKNLNLEEEEEVARINAGKDSQSARADRERLQELEDDKARKEAGLHPYDDTRVNLDISTNQYRGEFNGAIETEVSRVIGDIADPGSDLREEFFQQLGAISDIKERDRPRARAIIWSGLMQELKEVESSSILRMAAENKKSPDLKSMAKNHTQKFINAARVMADDIMAGVPADALMTPDSFKSYMEQQGEKYEKMGWDRASPAMQLYQQAMQQWANKVGTVR